MKKIFFLLLIFGATLFSSCKKKLSCGDVAAPVVTSNSPVKKNDDLKLYATATASELGYYWTGPNNFSSTVQNPVIQGVSYDAAGTYKLIIFSGDCPSSEVTMDIIVKPSCTPVNNSINYVNYFSDHTYTSCNGYVSSGHYTIGAYSFSGDIYFDFNTASEPTPGIYYIENDPCNYCNASHVSMTLHGGGSLLYTQGGQLYVEKTGGKLMVTFCGMMVSNGSVSTTADGKLTAN
ncbi:MAG: hypothetical protein ABI723_15055 [Bacteroidia bacterium]